MANLVLPDAVLVKNYIIFSDYKRGYFYGKDSYKGKGVKTNSGKEYNNYDQWTLNHIITYDNSFGDHNLVVDHFRKSKKMPFQRETDEYSIFNYMTDNCLNIEGQIISEQVETDLAKLLDELPADQKEVLVMRMYQDLSFKEIADLTGVSINTALGRMRYALLNLRKIIEKNQIILTN